MKIHMKVYNQMIGINSKIDEILRRSTQKSKMITNLINDLLDLAKFENSVFKVNEDVFNLIDVITEAFNMIAYSAEEKNIKLLLEFDQQKPNIYKRIYSDKRRFLQILLNIMSNSLKFIKRTKDEGYLKIKLRIKQEQYLESKRKHGKNKSQQKRDSLGANSFSRKSNPKRVASFDQLKKCKN